MKIKIIEPLGFCPGVKKTIDNIKKYPNTYLLEAPIHNKEVTNNLESNGYKIIDENDYYKLNNTTVITSAHGTNNKIRQYALSNNINIIDLTCSFINNINKIIENNQNKQIIILGDKNHQELKNILINYPNIICLEKIDNYIFQDDIEYLIIFQSTYNINLYNQININKPNVKIIDTICPFVKNRGLAINNLHDEFIIVIGDKTSSNANKLYQIAKNINKDSLFVENINDLKQYKINYNECTILSATSTDIKTINEIIEYLEKI